MLCGQCQQGLSAVFGSSQCEHCSIVYVLVIIPIAIAGIVLVLTLFIFNLTVINGTINTFIFYVNILNINTMVLFPRCQPHIACTVLSLLNLDLGITTCFYNGMDDYAKRWLQLAFPLYLVAIAYLLIVTSRYSSTMQRLTAHKALPVLATLFLLSYTKMLRTVSNVLFCYTKVTHLPSNITSHLWSVDVTAPLFGLKFMMLFVVCLTLVFIFLPFNLVLLLGRKLSCFRIVTKLKPFLDTYFGPYKDNSFYWTGLQLVIRMLVFGLSSLRKDATLMSTCISLSGLLSLQGIVWTYRNRFNNIQESLLLFNLLIIHVAPLYKGKQKLGPMIAQIVVVVSLAYTLVALACYCVNFKLSIQKSANKLYAVVCSINTVKEFIHKDPDVIEMDITNSNRDHGTQNCQEFREPLIVYDKLLYITQLNVRYIAYCSLNCINVLHFCA